MTTLSEAAEKRFLHALPPGAICLGLEDRASSPRCCGTVSTLVKDDAVPEQRVEERIAGVVEAHHIDFDPRGVAQIGRELQQVEILTEHGHVGIGVGAASAARTGAEEEGQADVFASAQGLA